LNADLLIGRPSQQALHDWPIGFAFCQGRGISLLVHRGDVRVSHEVLLHTHGCSGFVQPSTVGVAVVVELDPAKSQLKTCRNQVVGTLGRSLVNVHANILFLVHKGASFSEW
jgi:hypothetical protein